MHKVKPNDRGISQLILLLILFILGITVFVGWRVWSSSSEDPVSGTTNSTNGSPQKDEDSEDPGGTLERISTFSDSYSVNLPVGWYYSTCEGTDILFLAPSEDLLGKCDSGYFGAISISRNAGDRRAEGDPSSDSTVTEVSVTEVTIDRQPATKVSYTVGGDGDIIAIGTKFIRYQIFYEGNTYTIGTSNTPGETSFAEELDGIVRTFSFTE